MKKEERILELEAEVKRLNEALELIERNKEKNRIASLLDLDLFDLIIAYELKRIIALYMNSDDFDESYDYIKRVDENFDNICDFIKRFYADEEDLNIFGCVELVFEHLENNTVEHLLKISDYRFLRNREYYY